MGARGIYLYQGNKDTLFRIHGTNQPEYIGQAISSGCIRMTNEDVIDLYNRVKMGAIVVVLAPKQGDSPCNPRVAHDDRRPLPDPPTMFDARAPGHSPAFLLWAGANWSTAGMPLALRPIERAVERAGEPVEQLVDLGWRDDQRRAERDDVARQETHDQTLLLGELHARAAPTAALASNERLARLVGDEFDRADEPEPARLADQRMLRRARRAAPGTAAPCAATASTMRSRA